RPIYGMPRLDACDAEPLKQRIEVVANLLRRVRTRREIGVHLQEEVTALVQERRQIRGAEEGDRRAAAPRDERRDLTAGFLLQYRVAFGLRDRLAVDARDRHERVVEEHEVPRPFPLLPRACIEVLDAWNAGCGERFRCRLRRAKLG